MSRLIRATFKVSLGAFALKFAIFGFNAALASAPEIEKAGELLRIIAFLMSFSSVVHFSTARFVSKRIVDNCIDAKGAFIFSIAISILGALFVSWLCMMSIDSAVTIYFNNSYILALAYVFTACLSLGISDFLSLIGVGTGRYWRAVAAQVISAAAFLVGALLISLDVRGAYLISLILPVISALISIGINLRQLIPTSRDVVFPPLRLILGYSAPLFISGFCITPASMWVVNNVAELDSRELVIYVAAQNIFGLLVLAAGQINSASFYLLASAEGKSKYAIKSGAFAAATVIFFGLSIYIFGDHLHYIYGSTAASLKSLVPLITLAALPFVMNQIAHVTYFVSGRPWLIAATAFFYTAPFAIFGLLAHGVEEPVPVLVIGLGVGYILQLLSGVLMFSRALQK